MKTEDLRLFLQVVESGGFAAAGRALGLPTKQVSRRVAALEGALGVALLSRTTRVVRATPEGARFYQDARRIVDDLDAAVEGLTRPDRVAGEVRLLLPTLFADLGVVAALGALLDAHPELSVEVRVGDAPADLVRTGLDLAVSVMPTRDTSLVARRLRSLVGPLGASRRYLTSAPPLETPEDLVHHACLTFVDAQLQDSWTLTHWATGEVRTVPVRGRFRSPDSRVLRRALLEGLGVGALAAASRLQGADALVPVLPGWGLGPFHAWALMPRGRHRLARVRAVVDAVDRALGDLHPLHYPQKQT